MSSDNHETLTVESLLSAAGGCGLFQVLFATTVWGCYMPIAWNAMFMAYGIYSPGWTCLDNASNASTLNKSLAVMIDVGNTSGDSCDVFDNCKHIEFNKDMTTIVSEWGLVCSDAWIPSFVISAQMTGFLVGSYLGGHMGDMIGRKYTFYGAVFGNGCFSLIAAFSVNWQMFAVLELLLGTMVGVVNSNMSIFTSEFVPIRWRGFIATAPAWGISSVIFVVQAMLLKNWQHLLFLAALMSFLMTISACWVPESMRWLATKDKMDKAKSVAYKIAKTNKKPMPDVSILALISEAERSTQEDNSVPSYNVTDLFRGGLYKRTLVISSTWFLVTIVYNAISYGVKALSGDFLLNLLLFACIPMLIYPIIPFFVNRIGRKIAMITFFSVGCFSCFGIVIAYFFAPSNIQGTCITVLVLLTVCVIDSAWTVLLLYTLELFPTVVRGLGYGFASSLGRVGGIVAPYLIPKNYDTMYISYSIMGVIIFFGCLLLSTLPETKQRPLQDTMQAKRLESKGTGGNDDIL